MTLENDQPQKTCSNQQTTTTMTTTTTTTTTKSSSATALLHSIIPTLVNQWLRLLEFVAIPDEIYDLGIYLGFLLYFYVRDPDGHTLHQPLFLPIFIIGTFLFFIVYYETIDTVTVYRRVPHKIPKLSISSCLNCLGNICVFGVADYFSQRYLARNIVSQITAWEIVVTPIVWLLVQEVTFYFLHRLAHVPSIYPHVHKLHHKYRYSRPVYCQFCHLFETLFIQIVDSWSVLLFMKPQFYLALGMSTIMIRHNVGSHRAQPEQSNEDVGWHAMHHRDGRYNFGNLTFLDRWMGTEYNGSKVVSAHHDTSSSNDTGHAIATSI